METSAFARRWDLRLLRGLAALFLFATMALTFVDVVGRYLFAAPVYGATELIQVMLAVTIFSGMGLVSHQDRHIAVDLFDGPLTRRLGHRRDIAIGLISAVGLFLISFELARTGLETIRLGRVTVVLEFSSAFMSLPGAALCALAGVLQTIATVKRP